MSIDGGLEDVLKAETGRAGIPVILSKHEESTLYR